MYIWIHDKYSSTSFKQRLWTEKNSFDMKKMFQIICVKELLARVDKPGSTPGEAVFCFFAPFLSFLSV